MKLAPVSLERAEAQLSPLPAGLEREDLVLKQVPVVITTGCRTGRACWMSMNGSKYYLTCSHSNPPSQDSLPHSMEEDLGSGGGHWSTAMACHRPGTAVAFLGRPSCQSGSFYYHCSPRDESLGV